MPSYPRMLFYGMIFYYAMHTLPSVRAIKGWSKKAQHQLPQQETLHSAQDNTLCHPQPVDCRTGGGLVCRIEPLAFFLSGTTQSCGRVAPV